MPLNFDTRLSFSDPEILRFLEDDHAAPVHAIEPDLGSQFDHDAADRRPSGEPTSHTQEVVFLVEEKYRLLENENGVGVHKVIVALKHDVGIKVDYWLFLRSSNLSEAEIAHVRDRFHAYDPAQHGEDVEAWMRANLEGIDENDFEVEPCLTLHKHSQVAQDHDASQRKALFALLGIGGSNPPPSTIHAVGDYSLTNWAQGRNLKLVLMGRELVADDSDPPANPDSAVLGDADDLQQVSAAIDAIVDHIIPGECGQMRLEQIKLLTLAAWPEFKIEWHQKRIKIGCSRITISVPVLRIRITKLVFYVYFKVPVHIDRFIITIARTCAVRSALTSAVIGVVTSNIGAAVASFVPLFKRCIEQEIRNCLHPGLLLATEPGPWH